MSSVSPITSPSSFSVVAVEDAAGRGVGLVQRDGEIQMCDLVPEIQYRGAGKLMLRALEATSVYGLRSVYPMSKRIAPTPQ